MTPDPGRDHRALTRDAERDEVRRPDLDAPEPGDYRDLGVL